jgi:hypothetical protein
MKKSLNLNISDVSTLAVDFLFTIFSHANSERPLCFLIPAKRGKPDRETDFVIFKQNISQKTKKSQSPIIQESGGGKYPPLAGIRKPLAESGACEKNGEQALEEIHLIYRGTYKYNP